ncbi:hypothetical protein ETD86_30030 [Nonomuraea turkmeniaca]|uniref:Uncharacterized protein n=1 Tax=Nonomuraea turkmeniaca TaxID=103838 RepID=A0A5S4F9W3_9ACTN|nr:hypothetical protein [Nonomuraea turkmeniaca]TMR13805.1 hypothetical protein ETD86_30030 [Nonomuraea turkmeniaca]
MAGRRLIYKSSTTFRVLGAIVLASDGTASADPAVGAPESAWEMFESFRVSRGLTAEEAFAALNGWTNGYTTAYEET